MGTAARLLHDDTLDLTDRAAGCPLLLYGQQLSRTAAMTATQVTLRDSTVFVRFGHHAAGAGPLGVILTELIRTGRTHTGTGSPARTPWLFPGGLPGQPVTAPGSASACATLASTPWRTAGPRSPISPPRSPPPSSPTSSTCHRELRCTGHARPEQTGQATQRKSPGPAITSSDEYLPPNRPARQLFDSAGTTLSTSLDAGVELRGVQETASRRPADHHAV